MSSPSGAFFSLRCLIYKVHAVPGGTLLLYSISFRLSRTFFRSFLTSGPSRIRSNFLKLPHFSVAVKNFFHFSPAQLTTAPTALLEYQILPHLSIPFLSFFKVFFRRPIWARYSIYNVFAAARRHFGDRRRLAQVLQGFPHILCFSFVRWADIIGTIYERGRRFEILEDERRRQ